MRRTLRKAVFLITATSVLLPAQPLLHPTLSGFVFDAGRRTLNPILGLLGSAYVGSPVASDLAAAWPSPSNDDAVAVDSTGNTVLFRKLATLAPEVQIRELLRDPTLTTWNASGSAVALYSEHSNSLQLIRFSGSETHVEPSEVLSGIGAVQALAVNAGGSIAVAAVDGIYMFSRMGNLSLLANVPATSVSFGPDGLLYAASAGAALEIRIADGVMRSLPVEGTIAAVQFCIPSKQLWAVDRANHRALAFDLDGTTVADLNLQQPPAEFTLLNRNGAILLKGLKGNRTVFVLNAGASEPAVFFVPGSL